MMKKIAGIGIGSQANKGHKPFTTREVLQTARTLLDACRTGINFLSGVKDESPAQSAFDTFYQTLDMLENDHGKAMATLEGYGSDKCVSQSNIWIRFCLHQGITRNNPPTGDNLKVYPFVAF